ncbi:MAG: glycosyltransferase family 39 protein [Chloroflexi bacterium]|nr:glycosyltransferase family 39 protein [Chloroflexota bacterium]
MSLPAGLVEAIRVAATMRFAPWVFGLCVASERAIPHPRHFEEARNGWAALPLQHKDGLEFRLIGVRERWDACRHAEIATFGCAPDGSTASYPLFPALERIVALGGPHAAAAGLLVGFVATVMALWGIHRIVDRDFGAAVARRPTLLLAVFPTGFFLRAPFSEATFLALSVWAIERARHRGGWPRAAVLATLAGLARPVAVFLALPLAWLAYRDTVRLPGAQTRPKDEVEHLGPREGLARPRVGGRTASGPCSPRSPRPRARSSTSCTPRGSSAAPCSTRRRSGRDRPSTRRGTSSPPRSSGRSAGETPRRDCSSRCSS